MSKRFSSTKELNTGILADMHILNIYFMLIGDVSSKLVCHMRVHSCLNLVYGFQNIVHGCLKPNPQPQLNSFVLVCISVFNDLRM